MTIARRIRVTAAWVAAIAMVPACNAISGVGDYEFPYVECFPDEVISCYSGPPMTQDIGVCRAGQRRCSEDGAQFGSCEGEVTPGPVDNCATPQDDNCDGKAGPQCTGAPLWVKAFGAGFSEAQQGNDVGAVADGRVILCGAYDVGFELAPEVMVEGSNETPSSFVAGLTPGGDGVWAVGESSSPAQAPRVALGMAVGRDDGSAYVVGNDSLSLYAQKLSGAGAVLWEKQFGSGMDGAVATHGSGLVLIGSSMEAIDFGGGSLPPAGNSDAVVASLTAAGDHVWSRRFGAEGEQLGRSIATDAGNNVVVAGCFQGTIDLGCTPALTNSSGQRALFVARLSPAGECLWSQAFPFQGNNQDCKPRVAADASGSVLFAASLEGEIDFGGEPLPEGGNADIVVAKFGPDGSHLWSKRFGDNYDQTVEDAAFDVSGNVLLTGSFLGQLNFGDTGLEKAPTELMSRDGFVVKFDPAGNLVWSLPLASTNNAYGLGVTGDRVGNVLVTGWFDGNLTVGDLTAEGSQGGPGGQWGRAIFVAKLSP